MKFDTCHQPTDYTSPKLDYHLTALSLTRSVFRSRHNAVLMLRVYIEGLGGNGLIKYILNTIEDFKTIF